MDIERQSFFNLHLISIDLFSLYILFSHFRPRDATRGNSFFQMSSYARANLRITNEKTKGKFPWGHHVVWNGKQNVQVEKVYWWSSCSWRCKLEASVFRTLIFIYYCWHNLSTVFSYSEYLSMFFHLGLTNTQHGRNISFVHWIDSRYADSHVDFHDKDLPLKDNMLKYCCKILLGSITIWQ